MEELWLLAGRVWEPVGFVISLRHGLGSLLRRGQGDRQRKLPWLRSLGMARRGRSAP